MSKPTTLQVQSQAKRIEKRNANAARFKRELEYIAYDAREADEPAVKRLACKCNGKGW